MESPGTTERDTRCLDDVAQQTVVQLSFEYEFVAATSVLRMSVM